MGLESATYINSLDSANPSASDAAAQGDDHIRLIKAVLKATFPNLTGPVTATQGALNTAIPIGVILQWVGTVASVPAGWGLCDGTIYTRTDGAGVINSPDLRNKFVLGAGNAPYPAPWTTGGQFSAGVTDGGAFSTTLSTTAAGAHSHGGATVGHQLTLGEIPSHTHAASANSGAVGGAGDGPLVRVDGNTTGGRFDYIHIAGGSEGNGFYPTGSAGGNGWHDHGIVGDGTHAHTTSISIGNHSHTVTTIPPYLALAYIMKI